ncbi:MAG: LysM peptidoglycan-binding domain-containing protein [Bdellovibrionales bacterium]|nr:LysM peptidoglycan-binding domain-containing protein [Bdellovibrionales bacterium]
MNKTTVTSALLILASQSALAAKTTKLPTEFISDDSWKKIAETQLTETYTIAKGDTLWDISKKLFGDPYYWPKIWQINGKNIPNPDLIFPSKVLSFSPGSSTSLPSLDLKESTVAQNDSSDTEKDVTPTKVRPKSLRSQEWREMPTQSWEQVQVKIPLNTDSLGFDLKTRYVMPRTRGVEIPWVAASEELPAMGSILAAKNENALLTINDFVYIRRESDELQIGKTYAITTDPSPLKNKLFDSDGLAYPILGRVTIIAEKDEVWIGQIRSATGPFERRESFLIKIPGRKIVQNPIPSKEPISATFMTNPEAGASVAAQHAFGFIDRGTSDGVEPGMVFRAYQYTDPADDREITESDVVPLADVQVIQASEKVSLVLVIRSLNQVLENGQAVVSLTDVSDLIRKRTDLATDLDTGELQAAPEEYDTEEAQKPQEKDDLGELESDEALTDEEKKNLNQLENHQQEQLPEEEALPQEDEALPSEEPSEETPSEEMPSEETPSEEMPSEETPSEEMPKEEAPSEDSSSSESPSEEPSDSDSDSGSSMDEPASGSDEGSGEAPF